MAAGYQPEGVCPGDNGSILLVFLIAMLFYSRLWMMAVLFPLGMKYYERMICQVEEKGKRRF